MRIVLSYVECDKLQQPEQQSCSPTEPQHFLLKNHGVPAEDVNGNDIPTRLFQPALSGRTRNSMSNGKVQIVGILNPLAESMVVLFLYPRVFWHPVMFVPDSARGSQIDLCPPGRRVLAR